MDSAINLALLTTINAPPFIIRAPLHRLRVTLIKQLIHASIPCLYLPTMPSRHAKITMKGQTTTLATGVERQTRRQ